MAQRTTGGRKRVNERGKDDEEKVKRLHARDGSVKQEERESPPRRLPGTSSPRFLLFGENDRALFQRQRASDTRGTSMNDSRCRITSVFHGDFRVVREREKKNPHARESRSSRIQYELPRWSSSFFVLRFVLAASAENQRPRSSAEESLIIITNECNPYGGKLRREENGHLTFFRGKIRLHD